MTPPYTELAAALSAITRRVRTDITAVKRADGRQAWTTEPLTPERMARHLNGGPARGVCPIKAGESVTLVGLLDFDSHGGETSWPEMASAAALVMDTLVFMGAAPIAFKSSGGRGVHVYCLWDDPQDAYSVRTFLGAALEDSGLRPGVKGVARGEVEVFPKQDSVPADGNGSQFILPLAGASVPLECDELAGVLVEPLAGREAVLGMSWPSSWPVPVLERPERAAPGVASGAGLSSELLSALAVLNAGGQDLSYDEWRNVVFAIHHETSGSSDGLALAHEVSARSMLYDPAFLDERVWPYIRSDGRAAAVTGRTALAMARARGWSELDDTATAMSAFTAVAPAGGSGSGGSAVGAFIPVPDPNPLPTFTRDRAGAILPTATNAVLAMRRADLMGWRVGHDEFKDEITIADAAAPADGAEAGWRPMRDADLVDLRMAAERLGFKTAPKELVRDAVVKVCEENRYDSAQMWLQGLENNGRGWDGVPRCERFFVDYFGCTNGAYTRAVGLYLWTALAGRVLDPGCQADMAPILEGDQGLRKSSAIAALVPGHEFFIEVDFAAKEEDTSRRMRGALVGEIAELRGLHTRDEDAIKKFMTRRYENWIPKYKEFSTTFPRRIVFVGTVNPKTSGFLADETGNRRWLPLHVERADVEAIERDRDQLWAEAAALWRARAAVPGGGGGVAWQDAERLAAPEHARYMIADEWEGAIETWLGEVEPLPLADGSGVADQARGRVPFTVSEVASGALGIALRDVGRSAQLRVGAILRKLGYRKSNARKDGKQATRWVPLALLAMKSEG